MSYGHWLRPLAADMAYFEGCTAGFPWKYNTSLGQPEQISITKTGIPPEKLTTKKANRNETIKQDQVTFIDNAGIKLSNITKDDTGDYEVRVFFLDEKKFLFHKVHLNVLGKWSWRFTDHN